MKSVVIGIATFCRPRSLRRTLSSLSQTSMIEDARVCVVDNDPLESARSVVDAFGERLELQYLTEPRLGVVHVRNRLLEAARCADAVIFIDDDETVTEQWLSAMLELHAEFPDDVITGPVEYRFANATSDPYVRAIYHRENHQHSGILELTGTGNTLVPISAIQRLERPAFDEAFGECGGEDTDFIRRLRHVGVNVRWCAPAQVFEHVDEERATRREALKRAERNGFINGMVALSHNSRLLVLAGAVARITRGAIMAIAGSRTLSVQVRAIISMRAGIGRARAAIGGRFAYYGRRSW